MHFPDAKILQAIDLGYDSALADICWLGFIQYIGDRRARQEDHSVLASRFLDLITYIDPRFIDAFYFVAFTVGGEQQQPRYAAHLIERGLQANESDWRLPYIAGFNYYLFAHDDVNAAACYERASSLKGAPSWLAGQSKILRAKIPSMLKEAGILDGVLGASPNRRVQAAARRNLITLLDEIIRVSPSDKISYLVRQRLIILRSNSESASLQVQ